jgi:hypothetical protein
MANGNNSLTTVTGTVERTNDSGIMLEGGRWINFSNYGVRKPSEGGPPAPATGTVITAQLKNDKFIQNLTIGALAPEHKSNPPAPAATTPVPTAAAPVVINDVNVTLTNATIETRQTLLKTLAVANPGMFTLDKLAELTEIVRNLEQFVLEDLIAANTPEPEPELDDLLDDEADI